VIVGVLLVIVFATLLRPADTGTLFGIAQPADDRPGGAPGLERRIDTADERREAERKPGRRRAHDAPAPAAASITPGLAPTPVPAGAGTGTEPVGAGAGDAGSPTDDQYGDTLSRLAGRIG
jgi:hypothetical protein